MYNIYIWYIQWTSPTSLYVSMKRSFMCFSIGDCGKHRTFFKDHLCSTYPPFFCWMDIHPYLIADASATKFMHIWGFESAEIRRATWRLTDSWPYSARDRRKDEVLVCFCHFLQRDDALRHHDAVHAHLGLPSAVGCLKMSWDVLELPHCHRSYDMIPFWQVLYMFLFYNTYTILHTIHLHIMSYCNYTRPPHSKLELDY